MAVITAAQGARSQLLFKKQTAIGTQASGDFTRLRYSTHSLNTMIGGVESNEIRQDREVQDYRHGNRHAEGDIVCPLIYEDHDDLIESAMFSTFGSDSIQIGTSPQYLSIEDGALDISEYRMFVDMIVNSWNVSMSAQGDDTIIRQTFNMRGTDGNANAGSSSGGTPVAASNNQPFDTFSGAIYDDLPESGEEQNIVTSLNFTLENGVNPTFAVGQQTAVSLEYGRGRISGEITVYYTDEKWLNRFLNETESALVVNLTDPDSNALEFRFPRIKFTGGNVPVENEQSRLVTLPFVALRGTTPGSALQVTKA